VDEHRIKAAQGAFEGMIVADSPQPAAWFREAFVSKYGEAPGLSAENGYDAVVAYSAAIRAAKTDTPVAVKAALTRVEFAGASGPIQFNSKRTIEMQAVLYEVKNTSLVRLGS
jgi:ABC-type branched-subunit amino acid transport system substrate-binding protein